MIPAFLHILRKPSLLVLTLPFLVLPFVVNAGTDMIIGGKNAVDVRKGDSLSRIGARSGADWQRIARENGLDPDKCRAGSRVFVNNRRIVPKVVSDGIVINIPDKMLYFFKKGRLSVAFPVSLGLPRKQWHTPTGKFSVVRKENNPVWFVPKSIQEEMEKKGRPVKAVVRPGPDNPLGRHAIRTSIPGVLIHEASGPDTIYQWQSHGCIRVSPETMEGFFEEVKKGVAGEIIYRPVSIAVHKRRVFLQVDRDIYGKIPSMAAEVKAKIGERGLTDSVDWAKVAKVVRKKEGVARDVTR
jgi:L,D-transpeptidase ErfK/SrfK